MKSNEGGNNMSEILKEIDDFGEYLASRIGVLSLTSKELKHEDSKYFSFLSQEGVSDGRIIRAMKFYCARKGFEYESGSGEGYFKFKRKSETVILGTMTNSTINPISFRTLQITLNEWED